MNRFTDIDSDNSIIDQDNKARAERLALKLARLKNVAVDIEQETRDHIPMLDNVDNSYEKTLNALSSGHNRLLGLLKSSRRGRQLFCYIVLIFFTLLIFMYFYLGR